MMTYFAKIRKLVKPLELFRRLPHSPSRKHEYASEDCQTGSADTVTSRPTPEDPNTTPTM